MSKVKYSLYTILLISITFFFNNTLVFATEETYTFDYTGDYQTWVVPYTGEYKLEVWGARGGGSHQNSELGIAGAGGYSSGIVKLCAGEQLYVYVGQEGSFCNSGPCLSPESYNGGGSGYKVASGSGNPVASGGGATDIRLVSGYWNNKSSLLSRIIVAGGGGGGAMDGERGGEGGGLTGYSYSSSYGDPGTQTSGWAFGYGFGATKTTTSTYMNQTFGTSGAGGGWYGGMNATYNKWESGGGGSGFVWSESSKDVVPSGYSVLERYYLSDTQTITGNQSMPTWNGTSTMTGNTTNGHAKITLLKKLSPLTNQDPPIYLENLELTEFYQDSKSSYEVVIPSSPYATFITYDTNNYIWASNVGEVELVNDKVHNVILMDLDGNISVYSVYPVLGKAKLNNVTSNDVMFEFENNVFEYDLVVSNDVNLLDLKVEADSGINYTISDRTLKVGNNKITIEVTGDNLESSIYIFNVTRSYKQTVSSDPIPIDFDYTGDYQMFVAPYTTTYILEVWGARGGGNHQISELGVAGHGGYSKGTINLNAGDILYVYVGAEGAWCGGGTCTSAASFNGGGTGYKRNTTNIDPVASGGGATDIRLISGEWDNQNSLLSRIIVAGGGGGGGMDGERGGEGGGTSGYSYSNYYGTPGTQTSGWAFGYGFSANLETTISYLANNQYGGSGAGGGWYGGMYSLNRGFHSGGGGSGFVWTSSSSNVVPSGYIPTSDYYLTDAVTIAGNASMPTWDGTSTMTGNNAAGHARISYYDPTGLDALTSLTVDKGSIVPSFDPDTYEYFLSLNVDDTVVTFEAETLLGEALVTGLGTFEVEAGENEHLISLLNIDGSVTVYNITISRPASPSAILKGFKVNGILYEEFDPDVFEYEIEIPTELEKINLELIKQYPGQIVPEDTIYDFTENEKLVNIIVSSEMDLANQPYTFKFVRKKSSELKILEVTNGTLTSRFAPSKKDYDLETPTFIRELPINAVPYFEEAVVSIVENRYVGENDTKITITVELEGVETSVYTLNIVRIEALLDPVDEGYEYTGDYQTFIAPASALYTLEVWGASGGGYHQDTELGIGGLGGYSRGSVYLNVGEKLYIYVGETGGFCKTGPCQSPASYNGGGSGYKVSTGTRNPVASGGGATDIRFVSGDWNNQVSLLSRLIVAGGGGGGAMDGERGGEGGGVSGYSYSSSYGAPGTQTTGWAFGSGFGATKSTPSTLMNQTYGTSGAGGGWYGGMNATYNKWESGGGGSGFVWTKSSSNNVPKDYSVDEKYYLTDTETLAGNEKVPTHDGTNLMTGNKGNGYARITAKPGIIGDAFLDNIIVDNGNVKIDFEPWTLTYNIELSKEYSTVNINAIPKDLSATVRGIGDIKLIPGLNEHKIIVSTEDGASKTYTLNITREASDDSTPQNIVIRNPLSYMCGLSPAYCLYTFSEDETRYEILYPFATEELTFDAILKSDYQSVKYYRNEVPIDDNGTYEREEVTSRVFTLHEGVNIIEVDITSEDKKHITTYTYEVRKDDAGNNNLAILRVNDPEVEIDFAPNIYEYYITIPSTYDTIDMEAITQNPDATKKIIGNENLVSGMNEIRVVVTAPNGNEKTYILYVFKEQSTNTFLNSLIVTKEDGTEVEITPVFNKVLLDYTGVVEADVKSVTINASAEEGTVSGTGTFNLESGNNEFEIMVTSESGDVQVYKVDIYKSKNNNSNLLDIEVEGYTIDPVFDKDIKSYQITVPNSVTKVNVIVTPEEETTTYTIRGQNNLTLKSNVIVVTSIAEDKSYQTYQIIVNKEVSTNNYLSDIVLSVGELDKEFDKDTDSYVVDVDADITSIKVTGIPEVESTKVSGNGTYALEKGSNTVTLTSTSESGETRVYTLTINREMNTDTSLKSVENNRGSLVSKSETEENTYIINVQYEVTSIDIKGIANSTLSTVTGNKTYYLTPGENNITLRVTSEAGTSEDYIVKVVRDLSSNDDLSFLYVEEGGLIPSFNETTIYYDVFVPNDISDTSMLHIEAIPEDKDANVDITFDEGILEVGVSKEIKVIVTAPNGKDTKVYTLNIIRQEATSENLSLINLETDRGELVPTFNPDTLNYTLTVENDITDITVSAEAMADDVIVSGTGKYNLKVGKNAIAVFVKSSETGIQRDYQIVVTRKVSSDASLSNLVVSAHTLSPSFNKETLDYTLTTSSDYLSFTTIKTTEVDATYVISGNEQFKSGTNIVTIEVTAPDGQTKKTYTLTVNRTGSKNNNLSFLEVQGYNLTPAFHKGVTFYTVDVPNDLNSVIINAKAEDSSAKVEGTGLKVLEVGENYFNVVVTSETDTIKTYTILITKDASDNNYLSSLTLSDGELSPDFDKLIRDYTLTVPYTVNSISVNGTLEDSNATVMGLKDYVLNEGVNVISIVVTSQSGSIRTYTLTVTKEPIISPYLSSLYVKGYDLDSEFDREILEYFVTVNYETTKLALTYTTVDKNATVVVSGNDALEIGMNEVHITVTSSDGSETMDYVIYVNRQMSTNNYLSSLTVDEYELTPIFDPNILEYTVIVPRDKNVVNIKATTQDASATITSGVGEAELSLGQNVVNVKVRSMMGVTRTYKVNIIRKQSSNNYLQNLTVSNMNTSFALTPSFDKLTNTYELNVSGDLNFIQIKVTPEDENAIVSGSGTKEINTGENVFDIVVTAEDGSINTYTLKVTKEVSSNNYLASLVPSAGGLTPSFDKDTLEYTIDLDVNTSELSFKAIPESNLSKVTGCDSMMVTEGQSVRVITVTAEDGSVRTYKITVNKETASNALLESLSIDGYEFEFDPNTFTYNIQVSRSKKTLLESEITAVPKDSEATVNMMGDLDLVNGMVNIYVVEVIAKDGYTTQEYKLNVTRDSLDYTLRSDVYKIVRSDEETYTEDGKTYTVIDEDYVIGIEPDTNSETFINNFLNEDKSMLHVYDLGEVMISEVNVGTSYKIKLESEDYVYDELVVIVRGDLTKDGKVNITDQAQMISYIGKVVTFDKYQTLAADITKDGKVNITDQAQIISYIGKVIKDIN